MLVKVKKNKSGGGVVALNRPSLTIRRVRAVPEIKFSDTGVQTVSPMTTAGSIVELTTLTSGSAPSQYVGQALTCLRLHLRCQVSQVAGLLTGLMARLIVIQDLESVTAAVVADVLAQADPLGMYNQVNQRRFRILWDMVIPLWQIMNTGTSGLALAGAPRTVHHFVDLDLGKLMMRFGTTASSNPITGALRLLQIANGGSACNLSYNARLLYLDD